jgi:hypothetical protein
MTWFERVYHDRDGMCPYLQGLTQLGLYGNAAEREPRFLDLVRRIEEGGKEPSPPSAPGADGEASTA